MGRQHRRNLWPGVALPRRERHVASAVWRRDVRRFRECLPRQLCRDGELPGHGRRGEGQQREKREWRLHGGQLAPRELHHRQKQGGFLRQRSDGERWRGYSAHRQLRHLRQRRHGGAGVGQCQRRVLRQLRDCLRRGHNRRHRQHRYGDRRRLRGLCQRRLLPGKAWRARQCRYVMGRLPCLWRGLHP